VHRHLNLHLSDTYVCNTCPLAVVVSVAFGGGAGSNGSSGGDTFNDLGDNSATVLPIDYVLALMALFGLMVADRTVCFGAAAAATNVRLGREA